jgi:hypothetical protein
MSSDTAAFPSRTSTSSIFFVHNQMFYRSGVFSGTLSHCSPTARRLYRLRRLAALHTASTSASLSSIFFLTASTSASLSKTSQARRGPLSSIN